ncbi:MAG: fumarylacetoacetate hydrolase family protein [bacterium]
MDKQLIEKLAEIVDEAARKAQPITMLTEAHPTMTLDDAYRIQRASIARRLARGEALLGLKMGLTSRAKMEQMGVHNPIYGHLTDEMARNSGDMVIMSEHCHPRVEPEIAFLLERDLSGKIGIGDAKAAIGGICGALEVIDSRYKDFKFTLIDVVADNASSTRYVLGDLIETRTLDVSNLGMVMKVNGAVKEVGSSAAILDHPLKSLVALVHMLDEVGEGLKAGHVVLAGGATKAIALEPGSHVSLEVQHLGTVDLHVSGAA